jgi:DivIVA domain-containing protein
MSSTEAAPVTGHLPSVGGEAGLLTPADIRNKVFTTVRLREGYDLAQVDTFLDQVEATLSSVLGEERGADRPAEHSPAGLTAGRQRRIAHRRAGRGGPGSGHRHGPGGGHGHHGGCP